MIEDTVSPESARRIYDSWGSSYDLFGFMESNAKRRALELLQPSPGDRILNVGVGTGKEHLLMQQAVISEGQSGLAVGLDLSPRMLQVARKRTQAPMLLADAHFQPLASRSFDRLYCAYVLDLIPLAEIPVLLDEYYRLLKPGGMVVLLTLTEGVSTASKAVVGLWKAVYRISPFSCGGCRPLEISGLVKDAGFDETAAEIIVQFGVPSQIICAMRPTSRQV